MQISKPTTFLSCFFLAAVLITSAANGQSKTITNPHHPAQPDSVDEMIRVTLVAEFGGDDAPTEALISGPAGVAMAANGNVYIVDAMANQIKMFTAEGTFLKTIGSPGEGPGEFSRPYAFFTDGTTYLYVQDNNNTETERFLLDGTFVDKHTMSELGLRQPNLVGVLAPSKLVYAQSVRGTYGLDITIVDTSKDWEVSSTFVYSNWAPGDLSQSMAIPAEVTVAENKIIVAHPFRYEYRIHDESGSVLAEMKRDFEGLIPPYAGKFREMEVVRFFSNLLNPIRLNEDLWLGRAIWPTNLESPKAFFDAIAAGSPPKLIDDSTWDLFDADWNLKYSLSRKQILSVVGGRGTIGTDGQGHIFVISETGSVLKYKIDVLD